MEPEEIEVANLVFVAERCPACDGEKETDNPFCSGCISVLPVEIQEFDRDDIIIVFQPILEYLKNLSSKEVRWDDRSTASELGLH